jgi:hypothetical protein
MKLGHLWGFLALSAFLWAGCLGGENDTLAPQGPSNVRIIYLATDRTVPLTAILMDGRALWTPQIVGDVSPRWEVESGTHHFMVSGTDEDDSVFAFPVTCDLQPTTRNSLVISGDSGFFEAFLIQDRLYPSDHDPQMRFVNALSDTLSMGLSDEYHVQYFTHVGHNQASSYRSFSHGNYTFFSWDCDRSVTLRTDTTYTMILSGSTKYADGPGAIQLRIYVDTPMSEQAVIAKP